MGFLWPNIITILVDDKLSLSKQNKTTLWMWNMDHNNLLLTLLLAIQYKVTPPRLNFILMFHT